MLKPENYFHTESVRKNEKKKNKVGGRSPQNDYNNKHKKVAYLGFVCFVSSLRRLSYYYRKLHVA